MANKATTPLSKAEIFTRDCALFSSLKLKVATLRDEFDAWANCYASDGSIRAIRPGDRVMQPCGMASVFGAAWRPSSYVDDVGYLPVLVSNLGENAVDLIVPWVTRVLLSASNLGPVAMAMPEGDNLSVGFEFHCAAINADVDLVFVHPVLFELLTQQLDRFRSMGPEAIATSKVLFEMDSGAFDRFAGLTDVCDLGTVLQARAEAIYGRGAGMSAFADARRDRDALLTALTELGEMLITEAPDVFFWDLAD